MTDLKWVTYCGLYCGLCTSTLRIPRQARELRDTMRGEGYEIWGPDAVPRFQEFWQVLNDLAESGQECSCREKTCGPGFCSIRGCAAERGVEVCPFCEEYPCGRISALAEGYVNLIADGQRMKRIGLDQWIQEQKERQETGFAYVDIRCSPYTVPDD